MCVLAGTSNPVDFLTDRTGNRRFLPVKCWVHEVPNPHDDEIATKALVIQAWGEIMDEFMRAGGSVPLHDWGSPSLPGVAEALRDYEKEIDRQIPSIPLCDVGGTLVLCK